MKRDIELEATLVAKYAGSRPCWTSAVAAGGRRPSRSPSATAATRWFRRPPVWLGRRFARGAGRLPAGSMAHRRDRTDHRGESGHDVRTALRVSHGCYGDQGRDGTHSRFRDEFHEPDRSRCPPGRSGSHGTRGCGRSSRASRGVRFADTSTYRDRPVHVPRVQCTGLEVTASFEVPDPRTDVNMAIHMLDDA